MSNTSLTPTKSAIPSFDAVPVRARHDGWTPERQLALIEALAECGCVDEACRRVGMSVTSAYALKNRAEAKAFRLAWSVALELAVDRLADAAFSRALNGTVTPIFFQGEQVGERRHFDQRLTMFLLRYRDPVRFGKWLDTMEAQREPETLSDLHARSMNYLADTLYDPEGADPVLHGLAEAPPAPPPADAPRPGETTEDWLMRLRREG